MYTIVYCDYNDVDVLLILTDLISVIASISMKEQRQLPSSVYNGQALISSASFKTKTNVISPVAITSQKRRIEARETKQTLILTLPPFESLYCS